ncbi:MAG: phosphotransferase family protein [Porticoccaceae bacterium]
MDIRQTPTKEFIESVREQFNVEPEIDRVLTRKMELRSGAPFSVPSLDELYRGVVALIGENVHTPFAVKNSRWLAGGAAKIQMAFDLEWRGLSGAEELQLTPLVLRMAPAESTLETSRLREFQLLKAIENIVPVPKCYWIDDTPKHFPYSAMIYSFAEGVTKPTASDHSQVTGIGTKFTSQWREKLAPQLVKNLADLHTANLEAMDLSLFEKPALGSNKGTLKQIDWWLRVWEEDREEAEPLITVAAEWLKANAPNLDHVSIIHGDFRSGNFLFSETTGKITAWLDWEMCVLGDRHQDLTWVSIPEFGNFAEDGTTFLASGLIPTETLFQQYRDISGLSIDPARLEYYRIFNLWLTVIICLATSHRSAKGGKSHQDSLLAWLSGFGYVLLDQLRIKLAEKLS